ncbi:MAG: RtcB family protein [Clostridiales bacterium]|jgi:RNA-splicing ligase RtcB|nr:RtcB family protein [Clostridiales bacterium]
MFDLFGKYNTATIYASTADDATVSQILKVLSNEFSAGSKIRIMPDAHAGTGCVVGTTMTIGKKVVPNLVGSDIGCGMEAATLKESSVDLAKLDGFIRSCIPSGLAIRKDQHKFAKETSFEKLRCRKSLELRRFSSSVGTLGGGNHFIELGQDESGNLILVVHSGSRSLGKQVAKFYQDEAIGKLRKKSHWSIAEGLDGELQQIIMDAPLIDPHLNDKIKKKLAAEGRESEIPAYLKKFSEKLRVDPTLAYCEGGLLDDYLHDMEIAQDFASWNRKAIIYDILKAMKLTETDHFTTIHNYIDLKSMILRKGAVSAQKGEKVLIPMNMRDGSLICTGKGNPDWNFSAPHGAGRLMSRADAKEAITLGEFQESMGGIYTTSVTKGTIDESPMAYKPMEEIVSCIGDTVDIIGRVKPLYNFKAGY